MQEAAVRRKGLSGSTLKWIAVFSMLIDHSAYIFLGKILVSNGIYSVSDISIRYMQQMIDDRGSIGWVYAAYQIMRLLGRVAFPIFCFLLVEGFKYTGSRAKYAGRLFLFCLLSEVPFDLAFSGSVWAAAKQNVFFTLLLGFLCMWGMEQGKLLLYQIKIQSRWLVLIMQLMILLICCTAAEGIRCDYGFKGVLAITLLYLFRGGKAEQLAACGVSFIWEPGALLALLPIGCYNGERGRSLKYFFYLFYPAHLLILYLVSRYIPQILAVVFLIK